MKTKVYLFVATSFFLACTSKPKQNLEPKKPNIVFIFTDDQTYSSIHALGNSEIITPNMDAMVHEGTTFTNAYNMGSWSGAVCAASRAMLISGRSVWRANKFRQNWIKNDSIDKTWGKLLESNGYETYMTGKWHVDAPAHKVFEHTTHIRPGMPKDAWDHATMVAKFDSLSKIPNATSESIMPNGYNRPLSLTDTTWNPTDTTKGGYWKDGQHWSEVLKDDAIRFINTAKTSEKPFFMYLAFNAPHDPRQAPQEYQDMYALKNLSVPKSFLPEYPYRHDIANGDDLRDEALAPFPRTELAIKTHKKEYYASITHVDAQIGNIIEALKNSGKMDNTYIIFTADHGIAMGRHGLLGKQSLFDHSIRPPIIILGPDIPKNKKTNVDVYLQDAMATSLDLAGIDKPKYIEYNSFLNIAKGKESKSSYDAIYGAYLDVQRMIRKDGYKLMVFPKIKKILLFDLKNDPEEMNDISKLPEEQKRIKTLFLDLQKLQKEMDDPLDISDCIVAIN
ncbi:sulfatase [Cellulophaga algicola DSM 14237]|uniref:Sulfatase n=1 Tax=Cellulophaga algicola (strain DSM 14237 / IC166 / ACAM 630) TaxID=688270 RepID=E6X918_CELAD|nr:sulfatase-like hydrolase/transferase [Cellulophaga algicola]ADV49789.1 sulfatase [Cellulophaga algicola DSM 14237]